MLWAACRKLALLPAFRSNIGGSSAQNAPGPSTPLMMEHDTFTPLRMSREADPCRFLGKFSDVSDRRGNDELLQVFSFRASTPDSSAHPISVSWQQHVAVAPINNKPRYAALTIEATNFEASILLLNVKSSPLFALRILGKPFQKRFPDVWCRGRQLAMQAVLGETDLSRGTDAITDLDSGVDRRTRLSCLLNTENARKMAVDLASAYAVTRPARQSRNASIGATRNDMLFGKISSIDSPNSLRQSGQRMLPLCPASTVERSADISSNLRFRRRHPSERADSAIT